MSLSNKTNEKPCFLINWSLTGKRGREPTKSTIPASASSSSSSSSSEEDQQTAQFLLMLSTASTTTTTTTTSKDQEDDNKKHLCGICGKNFGSYQALGGHRAGHFKLMKTHVANVHNEQNPPFYFDKEALMDEEEDDDDDQEVLKRKKKKKKQSKKFECSICRKRFVSGQALGGHKRFHWALKKNINNPHSDHHSSDISALDYADENDVADSKINIDKNKKKKKKKKKIKSRLISTLGSRNFDLNLPPPPSSSSSSSSSDKDEHIAVEVEGEGFSSFSPASPLMPYCYQ